MPFVRRATDSIFNQEHREPVINCAQNRRQNADIRLSPRDNEKICLPLP